MDAKETRQGVLYALTAYLIWGIAPAYFKYIQQVQPVEIMTHRVIWSALFMIILISVGRSWGRVRDLCKQPKKLALLALSATVIGANWLLFIWAVNNHHMLEASLGYFINPLLNVAAGMIFLAERFRKMQWIAVALAGFGVLVQLWKFGSVPVIALGLACTFSSYGLIRKKIAVDAKTGMFLETLWLFPASAVYLFGIADSSTSHLSQNPWTLNMLLIMAGIITTVPLMLFTAAASRLRLSTVGFFQYLGPTLMFLLAVFFYGEQLTEDKLVTFSFIWLALALFIFDALIFLHRSRVTKLAT